MRTFPKPLTAENEKYYLSRLRDGDGEARRILIEYNLRLVAHIVKKYQSAEDDMEELISIGTIGLIKAVDTFDARRAGKFSSYASRCIENELRMELRRRRREGTFVSLQEPLESGDGGAPLTLADTLQDDADMVRDCEKRSEWARLRGYLHTLPAREQRVLELR